MPQNGTGLQDGNPHNGTRLQDDGQPQNGTSLTGARATQRRYRGLADLNGARLELAASHDAVALVDGQLVAPGHPTTASLRHTAISGTTRDGRTFDLEVVGISVDGRTERIEILADGLPVCAAGEQGLFVAGRWDERAAHIADPDVVTYSCSNGVIAKCVAWGYAPWTTDADVHAACTRLARADYCGDGVSWTRDGTEIDAYDRLGVHTPVVGGGFAFEAAWGASGALCASRTRYAIHDAAGRAVQPSCFATLPACGSLDAAAAFGAVLANSSKVTPIAACE